MVSIVITIPVGQSTHPRRPYGLLVSLQLGGPWGKCCRGFYQFPLPCIQPPSIRLKVLLCVFLVVVTGSQKFRLLVPWLKEWTHNLDSENQVLPPGIQIRRKQRKFPGQSEIICNGGRMAKSAVA